MNRSNLFLLAAAGLGCLGAFWGCSRRAESPPPAEASSVFHGPHAYDVIRLCRFSTEEGPVWFNHALHADLMDVDGKKISCLRCHHELIDPAVKAPKGCAKCHLGQDAIESRDLLTL